MPGRIPYLEFVEEGTGNLLFRMDWVVVPVQVDDLVKHTTDGGGLVTYKVEKVTMVLNDEIPPPPALADGYASVTRYVIDLSVVP